MEPISAPLTLLYILISFTLVLLNAFFVAAEFAVVKVRRSRLEELAGKGNKTASRSIIVVDQLDEYLSATQLGITLVSLALGWIGEESFYSAFVLLAPPGFFEGHATRHIIASGLSFFMLTLFHVVLGELVPKSMAIQRAEKITLLLSTPLRIFYQSAKPLIQLFSFLANQVLKIFGFHDEEEEPANEDELKLLMKESREEGVISEAEAQIINRAFEFSDKRVGDIMTAADQVDYLSMGRPFLENIKITGKRMYTRFPLAKTNLTTAYGIIHIKDLYQLDDDGSNEIFEQVFRPPLLVSQDLRQDRLLKLLREKRAHMALVHEPRTQKIIGIVTMEDILEEIVGEIVDEHGN